MSTNRSRRIDRDAAEQLLGGAVGGPSAGQDASLTGPDGPGQLARVLAAAAAPATAAELAGEEAALAAFREASLTPDPVVTPVRRRSMATAALARAFSTKAAAAVLGATALCGVAVAAGTGNLPSGLGGPSEPEHTVATTGSPTGSSSGTPTGTGTGTGSASPGRTTRPSTGATTDPHRVLPSGPVSPDPDGRTAGGHGDDRPAPPAALLPLCQGFADRTGKGERPRQLAADPFFAPLIAAAGGADGVQDYCAGAQGHQGDDHQGTSGSGKGAGKGSGNGSGNGNGNTNGNGSGNNGNSNGEDTNGGGGAKPGKGGVLPPPSGLPTLPDIHPSRTGHSEDDQAARR
ncbi:hypothetical protein ABTY61_31455 [Kitasatospora sp. NPDC096128]|uniref:hypothetical protein n=1 Tax=Kitasatospora sp. NPDC096128 TaxID=3155547 RepID=UPI0033255DAB